MRFYFKILGGLVFVFSLMGCASSMDALADWQLIEKRIQQAYERGDLMAAESLVRRHLNKFPSDADSWFMLGQVQLKNHQYQAAQVSFQKATQLLPTQALNWQQLAVSHIRLATEALIEADAQTESDSIRPLLHQLLELQTSPSVL